MVIMAERMKWLTSWVLYWTGDALWRVTLLIDSEFIGMAYQKVMAAAYRVQGDGDGPWHLPSTEDDQDARTARRRLKEIGDDSTCLITGDELKSRLDAMTPQREI